jgi:predicted AlkP superfamily pyrophosphatase or phosphodiesterase
MSNAAAVSDRRWWDEAEPIWVTAQKAGLTTATMFWPGSEAAIHGVRPAYWRQFDQSRTSAQRVAQVLAWLDLPPDARPRFVTLYFDAVDTAGHLYGPDSPQVDAALANVDSALGALTRGLSARRLAANLVIVSDHGMAAVSAARRIYLDDLVPMADLKAMTMGAFLAASPTPGHAAEAETALLRPHPHMQCWRKGQIPARYHYGRNPRVPAIVCLPQTGWEITTHGYKGRQAGGDHGFDPYDPLMAAIFIADGPAFRHGVVLPAFDNVDVYPLVARVIGVTPQPNDGHLAEVAAALAP